MQRERAVRYLWIIRSNLWLSLSVHAAVSVVLILLTPLLFGLNNLEQKEAAKVLEQYVSLVGIILITPIFLPEQGKDIREVVEAKYTSQIGIYFVRLGLALLLNVLLIAFVAGLMIFQESSFPLLKFILGTFVTSFFLGSLGLLFYAISDQIILGYMLPCGYYIFNFISGNRYVKEFYLFSLTKDSIKEKYWLFTAAVVLLLGTLLYKWGKSKLR